MGTQHSATGIENIKHNTSDPYDVVVITDPYGRVTPKRLTPNGSNPFVEWNSKAGGYVMDSGKYAEGWRLIHAFVARPGLREFQRSQTIFDEEEAEGLWEGEKSVLNIARQRVAFLAESFASKKGMERIRGVVLNGAFTTKEGVRSEMTFGSLRKGRTYYPNELLPKYVQERRKSGDPAATAWDPSKGIPKKKQ